MYTIKDVQAYWDAYPCGIQVTEEEEGSGAFFEDIKQKFRGHYDVYAHSDQLLEFRQYAGKSVLEIGCGIGLDSVEYARYGARVTAIDLSPKNVELTKKHFAYHQLHATIEVGNAEALRFTDNAFDLVIAIGVLYYTPNPQKGVEEILRVLKPDSQAICMFYNRRSWYALLARLSKANFDHEEKDPPLIRLFSEKELYYLYQNFTHVETIVDRFPSKTIKRSGWQSVLYNYLLVPFFKIIPRRMMRPYGSHIIVKAIK